MQSTHYQKFRFSPILSVIRSRKHAAVLVGSGLAYAIVYMLVVGIISYVPGLHSASGGYPVIRATSIGLSIIPAEGVFMFIFYGALAFLTASSFLVGLNFSLMHYSRKAARACITKTESKGLLGLLPAFFTSFSCCGGGLLALAIGPTAFSSLSLYSQYTAPLTVAVLAAGAYFMSDRISRMEGRK
jgi:hypothetical protein